MTFKTIVKAAEPKTFTASLLPVFYAGAYAFYLQGKINIFNLVLIAVGMMFVQGATNMINDYYDYKRQADTEGRADEKVLASGELTPKGLKQLIATFSGIALCIGSYFALTHHWGIFIVIGVAIVALLIYSTGPYPIAYTPFGELLSGFMMGILVVMTVLFIETDVVSWQTFLVSLPTFFYVALLLLSNNLSDWHEDQAVGRKTLVILLGGNRASWLWPCFAVLSVIATWCAAFYGAFHWLVAVAATLALSPQLLIKVYRADKTRMNKGLMMMSAGKFGIRLHGILMITLLLLGIMQIR